MPQQFCASCRTCKQLEEFQVFKRSGKRFKTCTACLQSTKNNVFMRATLGDWSMPDIYATRGIKAPEK